MDDSGCLTPSERRQIWKATFHVIPLNDILLKTRHRDRKQVNSGQGLGVGKEVTRKELGEFQWVRKNVLDCGSSYMTAYLGSNVQNCEL